MSVYPMKITTSSLDHHGGTKSYHFHTITNAKGTSILVNRWGKTGSMGEIKAVLYADEGKAKNALVRKTNEKIRNGYDARPGTTAKVVICNSREELAKAVGLYVFNKLGANLILGIDPDYNVTGMLKEVSTPEYDETGAKVNSPRGVDPEEIERRVAEEKLLKVKQHYSENNLYGRF